MKASTPAPDFWPKEREGYAEPLRPAYAAVRCTPTPRHSSSVKTEERIGAVIAGAGLCWAVNAAAHQFAAVSRVGVWPPGPLELCAAGILIWMHAKWRRSQKH